MGWNYPLGVSGNEPKIVGYEERRMEVECGSDSIEIVPSYWITQELQRLAADTKGTSSVDLEVLIAEVHDEDWTVDTECGFEGEVDVFIDEGEAYWTCPRCGSDQSTELDDGPDPDDIRDTLMDLRYE